MKTISKLRKLYKRAVKVYQLTKNDRQRLYARKLLRLINLKMKSRKPRKSRKFRKSK